MSWWEDQHTDASGGERSAGMTVEAASSSVHTDANITDRPHCPAASALDQAFANLGSLDFLGTALVVNRFGRSNQLPPSSPQHSATTSAIIAGSPGAFVPLPTQADATNDTRKCCKSDAEIQLQILRCLPGPESQGLDKLQIRRTFATGGIGTLPPVQQVNRILYGLLDAELVVKGAPSKGTKPLWKKSRAD
jgi:hypothetical protein